jgi:flagellar basal-body rod protein FlgG
VTSNEGDVGKFKIVRLTDSRQATKEGANLFVSPLTNVKQTGDARILQGQLEQSNVSPIDNMVSLIVIQRQFEAYQRAMSLMDSVTQKMIAEGAN